MKSSNDFLISFIRMQAQIEYLIARGEAEDFLSFNNSLDRMKEYWLTEFDFISDELRNRILALEPLNVEIKRQKHSWWSGVTSLGIDASKRFETDELREDIRPLRGQLAAIEFLFKSTMG